MKEGKAKPLEANARLHGILSNVLDMRIAIVDRQKVMWALQEGLAEDRSAEDVGEALISSLAPEVIELRLPPAYFKEMTIAYQGTTHDGFTMIRDGLFYELGLRYPRFHFVIDESLKSQSFTFKINHLTTTPHNGLPLSCCLVNAGADKLSPLGIKCEPVIAPLKDKLFSTIGADDRAKAKAANLTVWGQIEYLGLCLSVELRNNSRCLLNSERVQAELKQLGLAFPALVNALKLKVSNAHLTRVLRALVAEELSVQNLRLILERLLEFDYIVIDPLRYIVFDMRLAVSAPPTESWLGEPGTMAAFIRTGMKRYISHKYLRGRATLPVYLLDKDIEEALSAYAAPDADRELKGELAESQRHEILQAVRAQVGDLPPTASAPVILTTSNLRSAFREVIAPEFPKLSVLSYEELAPEMNIQPIARISLNTEAS
jgi:type III secretion protein V